MKRIQAKVLGFLLLGLVIGSAPAAAQSDLDVADAQEFMGEWLVTIEGEQGEVMVQLAIEDEDGKVAGAVTMIGLGRQPVTDITRSEDTLQFELMADAQGQLIPILVRLTPAGEDLAAYIEIGDGEFTIEGLGKRMEN
jgi:hypothetical protein